MAPRLILLRPQSNGRALFERIGAHFPPRSSNRSVAKDIFVIDFLSTRVSVDEDMPDTPDYLLRIRQQASGRDPLEAQAQTPKILAELVGRAPEERLTERPGPGKWSVGEILAHLAEDEIATAWRYRQMVEHSGIQLAGFDQDLWATVGNYSGRAPQESLALFKLLRGANLDFLRGLSAEQWNCFGMHAERGRITVLDLATHMAGHDANHVEQIRRIVG